VTPHAGTAAEEAPTVAEAESVLQDLAAVFFRAASDQTAEPPAPSASPSEFTIPNSEAKYQALVEQLPAVVFMAYLDRGIGEAYVSPRIEEMLGFSQTEWLEDPVRWYSQIHPDDQHRWSVEAAAMFLTGRPLKSAYRVLSRDHRVIWFQCEAKLIRRANGRPWFIHGVAFDITELKLAEQTLEQERNVVSAILDTVGALVVVLGPGGQIIRPNRACERITGYTTEQMRDKSFWDLFMVPDEGTQQTRRRAHRDAKREIRGEFEGDLLAADGGRRRIAWSSTMLPATADSPGYVIATGIDVTERKRMEQAVLEVGARVQQQIGQDLHDGLGQHLTGIAFMSKVLEQKLADGGRTEAADAAKIVRLVNEAVHKARELARGLLPVVSDADGLMSALSQWSSEVEDLFHIPCRFVCDEPVRVTDVGVATHLYHIAHEAVNNALRHGFPTTMVVSLGRSNGLGVLTVEDDGVGLPAPVPARGGLGLHLMSYRASLIGGTLELRRGIARGTVVCCRFPLDARRGAT
jgi:PAS domain S-box-containing protein